MATNDLEVKQKAYLLANRLKEVREQKGLTQIQASEQTGLTQSVISQLETGVLKRPPLAYAVALSGAYGCSLDYLIGEDKTSTAAEGLETATGRLVRAFEKLTLSGQEYALAFVEHFACYTQSDTEEK